MVCSTLTGVLSAKHPATGLMVRVDGKVLMRVGGKFSKTFRYSAGCYNKQGYTRIQFGGRQWTLHRLVAETFLPNYENKPTVDHIDRVRDNNNLSNLRWATLAEQRQNSATVLFRLPPGEAKRIWTVRNCDKVRGYKRAYKERNPEKVRECNRAYKERKRHNLA